MTKLRQVSFYGKGGVGKSIIAANLAASLAERGLMTMLVGCSPKADSTLMLLGHMCEPTILNNIRHKGNSFQVIDECIQRGYNGVLCAEAGGSEPASGCAGRGVFHTLQLLKKYEIFTKYDVDLAFFDVIADVVCGGFSVPMKEGFATIVYIITTAEQMSLYAANNICIAVQAANQERKDKVTIGGFIQTCRGVPSEIEIVEKFAAKVGVPVLAVLPRSDLVQQAEALKGTIIECFPDSGLADEFRLLARRVQVEEGVLPRPIPAARCIEYLGKLMRRHLPAPLNMEESTGNLDEIGECRVDSERPFDRSFSIDSRYQAPSIPRRISIYGKAGVGKSTVASNLSAVLAARGETVLQVGCDPKRDSVVNLTHAFVPTILEKISHYNEGHSPGLPALDDVIYPGFNGVWCAEAGGPKPGTGCAGQGVLLALEYLKDRNALERYGVTVSIYDVLGDVVCGGFAQPIRGGYCREIIVVTNAEPLSLIVTNNILKAVHKLVLEGVDVGLVGLIHNRRGVTNEDNIVKVFANQVGVPVIANIPNSRTVQQAEARSCTVIEAFPASNQSIAYEHLANIVLENKYLYTPKPLTSVETLFNLILQLEK